MTNEIDPYGEEQWEDDLKEMLEKIRKEYPNSVIHEVLSYNMNNLGFYDVLVDKESQFFETTILHTRIKLPYPFAEYNKLTSKEQLDWRMPG